MSESRRRAEQQFFDRHYALHGVESLNGFYELSASLRHFRSLLYRDCAGRKVLEYGCGPGGHAFSLAERGATVTGIDISATAIEMAEARARQLGTARLTFRRGDAEALDFADASFDIVCGTGILHHLDIDRAAREVRRVLAPGGRAVFYEPVGHNPVANLYRRLTPQLHTRDEHPLRRSDFDLLRRHFTRVTTRLFDLVSVGAIPLLSLPGGRVILRALEAVDRAVLHIPGLRWWASVAVIELQP